jgi:hypothetical protein
MREQCAKKRGMERGWGLGLIGKAMAIMGNEADEKSGQPEEVKADKAEQVVGKTEPVKEGKPGEAIGQPQSSSDALTPAQREAIRGFLWTIAIPSGVALTVLSTLFGFLLSTSVKIDTFAQAKDAMDKMTTAYQAALQKNLDTTSNYLQTTITESATVKVNSQNFQETYKATQDQMLAATTQAKDALRTVAATKQQLDDLSQEKWDSIAKSLLSVGGFKIAIAETGNQSLSELRKRIDDFGDKLGNWGSPERRADAVGFSATAVHPDADIVHTQESFCPTGTYVVGLKWWGMWNRGDCDGCVARTQLICRPLASK